MARSGRDDELRAAGTRDSHEQVSVLAVQDVVCKILTYRVADLNVYEASVSPPIQNLR